MHTELPEIPSEHHPQARVAHAAAAQPQRSCNAYRSAIATPPQRSCSITAAQPQRSRSRNAPHHALNALRTKAHAESQFNSKLPHQCKTMLRHETIQEARIATARLQRSRSAAKAQPQRYPQRNCSAAAASRSAATAAAPRSAAAAWPQRNRSAVASQREFCNTLYSLARNLHVFAETNSLSETPECKSISAYFSELELVIHGITLQDCQQEKHSNRHHNRT